MGTAPNHTTKWNLPNGFLCWARAWLYKAESYWTEQMKHGVDLGGRRIVKKKTYHPYIHQRMQF
jgi:hypothetical protein